MTRAHRIEETLQTALAPSYLGVADESSGHSVPAGSESHFKVVVVSEAFADQALIQRHRAVNELLAREFDAGLHALAIHAWTPEEWRARGETTPTSPPCRGGSKAASRAAQSRNQDG